MAFSSDSLLGNWLNPDSSSSQKNSMSWNQFASWQNDSRGMERDSQHQRGRLKRRMEVESRGMVRVIMCGDGYAQADMVILTSESQRPFVERDMPRERVKTILHGVESGCFTPGRRPEGGNKRLRMFLFGNTERDHAFTAAVAKKLPADRFEWRVRTMAPEKSLYADIPCVTMLPRLSDDEVLEEYRQADLLCMPMLDSAANNVFLESMACGTPVMTNRVGGVCEYVPEACNAVMPNGADTDAWAGRLVQLEKNRELLQNWRPAARRWAEGLDWAIIAEEYRAVYRNLG